MSDVRLGALDSYALRRRVLLTGVCSLAAFFAVSFSIAWLDDFRGGNDGFLIPAMIAIYFGITRPLMRPVREAIKLRHRLAYESYLDEKRHQGDA